VAAIVIALSIPVFFVMILIEALVAHRQGRRVYRFNDAITDLSCGIGNQVTHLGMATLEIVVYVAAASVAVLPTWPKDVWWTWVVALLLYDHQFYWWHRTTHRSSLFWTTHVVHHQSEEYNLAVALRQCWFAPLSGIPFYAPLFFLGMPGDMFVVIALIDLLYQFWIHTELIRTVGPLEWVFNTPSHHRVHHAVNPAYIDKNHGGIFIFWDRLYGTFQKETVAPTYGVVEPIRSFDPIAANFTPFVSLARKVASMPDLRSKLWALIGPPEWRPASMGGDVVIPEPVPHRITWDPTSTRAVHGYILVQFVLTGLVTGATLARWEVWSTPARVVTVACVLAATWTWGALFERKRAGFVVDVVRIAALPIAGALIAACDPLGRVAFPLSVAMALGSTAWWVLGGHAALPARDAT
jgi:sterol desaturase/sphingolipid hydroxylase (fatty acid hydroxylase superfamily)